MPDPPIICSNADERFWGVAPSTRATPKVLGLGAGIIEVPTEMVTTLQEQVQRPRLITTVYV